MADAKRVDCPVCGKDTPVLKDGTLRAHRYEGERCEASGLTPEAAAGLGVTIAGTAADARAKAEPAALVPEVITDPHPRAEGQPGTAVEPVQVEAALVAATEAALSQPGIAGRDEFLSLAMQARILSMSGAAPRLVRDDPHLAFHIALVGRDLGISPSAALELIDVLDTRSGPKLSLSPQLMNGQLRRLGLGSVKPLKRTKDSAIAGAYGPDGILLGESEFTWEDAVDAELADDRCEPGRHWRPNNGQGRCACNMGWKRYPKRMLWWRAAGFAADDYFPEASLGLYQPEALGALVDEDGRPIDPTTVALPEGYEPTSHGNGAARGALPEGVADGAALWKLQAQCHALPDEQKRQLREARESNERLRGHNGVIPIYLLSDGGYRVTRSLVAGFASTAERETDYDRAQATEAVLAHCAAVLLEALLWPHPTAAQIAQDDPPAPEDPPGDPGPPADTQAPETGDERDIEAELAQVTAEVASLAPDEVVRVLQQAKVTVPDGADGDALRELLVETIAEHRGLGA
jgi:hypothetical protein